MSLVFDTAILSTFGKIEFVDYTMESGILEVASLNKGDLEFLSNQG